MFDGIFVKQLVIATSLVADQSSVDFNIAASPGDNASPNVLSELQFRSMNSLSAELAIGYMSMIGDRNALGFVARYRDSHSFSGDAKDYDFNGDNRTEMFSLSKSSLDDSKFRAYSFEVFSKIRWFDAPGHYLVTGIGHDRSIYHLHITDGTQLHPERYKLTGLDSRYLPEFSSSYLYFETEHRFYSGFLSFRVQHLWTHLDAQADWNLRDNFQHPKSFIHDGEGSGWQYSLKYTYPLFNFMDVFAGYSYRDVSITNGYDQVFLSSGDSVVTKLNEVSQENQSLNLGVKFLF